MTAVTKLNDRYYMEKLVIELKMLEYQVSIMIDLLLNNLLTDPTVEDMSMKHELHRLWKEAVMVCTNVPSQNFPQGMHEYHKACKGRISHPRPSQTWCRTETAQRWIQKGTHKMELTVGNNECKINDVRLSAFLMWNATFLCWPDDCFPETQLCQYGITLRV